MPDIHHQGDPELLGELLNLGHFSANKSDDIIPFGEGSFKHQLIMHLQEDAGFKPILQPLVHL